MKAEASNGTPTGRNQFGTFGGVFTPCILTILGVILFLRANFVAGQAGILFALSILVLSKSITLLTTLSASAIATNMPVKGGGAYYLISRVLGPEFGGAIGILLFLAQALSVPFYILGFTEATVQTFPRLDGSFEAIAFGAAAALFVITYIGAGWVIRTQYLIMAILALAIFLMLGGAALRFDVSRFMSHLGPVWELRDAAKPDGPKFGYWAVFAIYFPAVTGIMAGVNMSGDLKSPEKAIPRGTLAAIGVGFLVYAVQILLSCGAFSRSDLVMKPYLTFTENALFGGGVIVTAGMFCATLSSALGSFMGAPRVLQAVGRDRLLPGLLFFSKGSAGKDEPRRGIVLTFGLTAATLLWASGLGRGGALNVVAALITEFFLYTYGMLNVAAFIEARGANPSFRPTFRWFHWSTALAGGIGCVAVAFIISPVSAAAGAVCLGALVIYLRMRDLKVAFGDARRGYMYRDVRNDLLALQDMTPTARNWRPTSLVFTGNPESREMITTYALWLEAGRGIVFIANILVGPFNEYVGHIRTAEHQLRQFCRERRLHAFPLVLADEDLEHGMRTAMQVAGVGPIRPNLAVFGWSGESARVGSAAAHYRTARELGMSLVLIHEGTALIRPVPKRIDVWWRGKKNGSLMILLAHLLTRNWEWASSRIRLLRVIPSDEGAESTLQDLHALLEEARVDAAPVVVTSTEPFAELLARESAGAHCVLLGFDVPPEGEEAEWHARMATFLLERPTTIMVSSTSQDDDLLTAT